MLSGCALRRTAFLIYPDFQLLDLTGPLAAMHCATHMLRARGLQQGYQPLLVARRAGLVRAAGGVELMATHGFRSPLRALDSLLVVGGDGVERAARDRTLLRWVERVAPRARRVGSVCTGAFVLGAAGLLNGRRVTTHWAYARQLAQLFPSAVVEEDAIYTCDHAVYTSAGITAGIDLSLALIAEDFGRELALEVARHLVVPLHRSGGQSQFSVQLQSQLAERDALRAVQTYAAEHVRGDLSVPALARRAAMSPRNFARVFRAQVGCTPAVYVERARVDVARRLLEQTRLGLEEVASSAGFGCARTLRRAFTRQLGVAADAYRQNLSGPGRRGHGR